MHRTFGYSGGVTVTIDIAGEQQKVHDAAPLGLSTSKKVRK